MTAWFLGTVLVLSHSSFNMHGYISTTLNESLCIMQKG